ncbi:uncharacterized protein [Rutidosis leptorrhynchoides]|uniref:uncharacterized protein n=1 Tax=Rutidosis leptorrhynchoides TaxID=125765 RepID=UPI003A994D24
MAWDTNVFNVNQAIESEFFLAIKGNVIGCETEITVVNVYGPHTMVKKLRFWDSLERLPNFKDMPWLVCGDFNEVRCQAERFNSVFKQNWADYFNKFISNTCLIEVPLGGKKFTRICDNGLKFSKLDRFLVLDKFCQLWPNLSASTLDKFLSDHCPIILRNGVKDFGPKPNRIFNEWLNLEGEEDVITTAWNLPMMGSRPDCIMRNKLKNVRIELKKNSQILNNIEDQIQNHSKAVSNWESIAESRILTEHERNQWLEEKKTLAGKGKNPTQHAKTKVKG